MREVEDREGNVLDRFQTSVRVQEVRMIGGEGKEVRVEVENVMSTLR